jgi:uncharacterized protein with ATP-grasp and redox domains
LKKATNDGAPENERKKLRAQIGEMKEKVEKSQQEINEINGLIEIVKYKDNVMEYFIDNVLLSTIKDDLPLL